MKIYDLSPGGFAAATYLVTEGDAALEGLPDYFKSFIKLLQHAGLDVEVKKYEQKDARESKGENDG